MALDSADHELTRAADVEDGVTLRAMSMDNDISVTQTTELADVESVWRQLETHNVDSPGQTFDFLHHWIDSFDIPKSECVFVTAHAGTRPVAILALRRVKKWGLNTLVSFPGSHVGADAPLVDMDYFAQMSKTMRAAVWQLFIAQIGDADLLYLSNVPETLSGTENIFEDFGLSVPGETLHRSVFDNWQECDQLQRSRSRRKHDKQQGAKLNAMGDVSFEVLDEEADVAATLECMFKQRAQRFAIQGILDPFAGEQVRAFYASVFAGGKSLKGRLHLLRLNGDIVAVRYNLVHGKRIFCLISSMSVAPEIQPGSPGKQCLLRVMQTEFDNGYDMFDMGTGMSDEKRHWCNQHIPLRHHYLPLTLRGAAFAQAHSISQKVKNRIKSDARLFGWFKSLRSLLSSRKV